MQKKLFYIIYIGIIFCLFLYSFTQVDLNLTLSRASWFQAIEKGFQYVGYFNRPLSTYIFIALLILLFSFYGLLLRKAIKNTITKKQFWILLFVITAILTFAYNAFSYDIFNYIFDAKIITHYHQNPYLHSALDFPGDKMLNFMRWTHRVYPYGPFWLVVTVPLSFIGLQIFLPTFFLFKLLMAGSFLGSVYYIQKISTKLFPKHALFNTIFFACNPLVLIESLVSAHLDIVMIFFSLMAIWMCINKKYVSSLGLIIFSAGIKFATGLLIPVFLSLFFFKKTKTTRFWETIFLISAALMFITVGIESHSSGNFQPWYLLIVLPFASFIGKKSYIIIPTVICTFFALLEYVPFLYQGDWNPPIPMILNILTISGVVLSGIITVGWGISKNYKLKIHN